MMKQTFCSTCIGIEAVTVTVEVDMSPGIGLHLVGLPDNAVRESLLRVTTAIVGYGFKIPGKKIVINLAPADIRKEGSGYDLAIAAGLLHVSEQVSLPNVAQFIMMGELSLDGKVRNVSGALPVAIHAREAGFAGCILPAGSALEAADISGIDVYGVSCLSDVIDILSGKNREDLLVKSQVQIRLSRLRMEDSQLQKQRIIKGNDFSDVKGQRIAKRGMEIAAAGGHNLILIGAPGSGKTLLSSCLPSILPSMTYDESLETSKIYSIAGYGGKGLMQERPFRTPHHSASIVSIIGGGAYASPGEISLAHNGVLYCDELTQFPRSLLDALRQPLEDGRVTISRARYKIEYPCSFMLIASMNPCPCGYYGDGSGRCRCTPAMIDRYLDRVSGPVLDRIDMHIYVDNVKDSELVDDTIGESSEEVALRVRNARQIQLERFKCEKGFTNARMNVEMLKRYCEIGCREKQFLKEAINRLNLSARAYSRILKLARTISDLAGESDITLDSLAEALQFRRLDRNRV